MDNDILSYVSNRVEVGVEAKNWVDAIRKAGELLEKDGIVERRYVEAMISIVEKLGAYIVLAPGIAIPHARPEDGALNVGLSIVVLAKPVEFGSPNDPVKVVIAFASPDKTSHLSLLKLLAELLQDAIAVEKLKNAKSVEDVKVILKEAWSRIKG